LPISKKIVEAHAGKLEYVKNNDSGTTFRVLIPAK
jgi:signal transduction histidine kinase